MSRLIRPLHSSNARRSVVGSNDVFALPSEDADATRAHAMSRRVQRPFCPLSTYLDSLAPFLYQASQPNQSVKVVVVAELIVYLQVFSAGRRAFGC